MVFNYYILHDYANVQWNYQFEMVFLINVVYKWRKYYNMLMRQVLARLPANSYHYVDYSANQRAGFSKLSGALS